MLLVDITKSVRLAFDVAGDLVKKFTMIPNSAGAFVPSTGKYATPAGNADVFEVEAMDDMEKESYSGESLDERSMRKYIVLSSNLIKIGYTFIDDGLTYTVSKLMPIQQNSVVFVYSMWAEA